MIEQAGSDMFISSLIAGLGLVFITALDLGKDPLPEQTKLQEIELRIASTEKELKTLKKDLNKVLKNE